MKTCKVCPKCDGEKFFHVARQTRKYCDASGVLRTEELLSAEVPTGETNLFGNDKTEIVSAEPLEMIVCAGCGFLEWYASPEALATLARIAAKTPAVRVVTNDSPDAPPYR